MNKSKIIFICVCVGLFLGLGCYTVYQSNRIKELDSKLSNAINNNKAFEQENSSLNGKILEFKLTADQLSASNDSLIQKLNQTKKELKIKDKEINYLQYIASENHKGDTVIVRDTIFQKGVAVDTTLGDNWSRLKLHAEYPNILSAEYSFKNVTTVVAHDSRVTVDPPKKCWLGRLFQKKQTIVEIDVVQENPYCENKEEKFVKIIKK